MTDSEEKLLEKAVSVTPDVKEAFKSGLKAVKNEHREKIKVADARKIGGSVDIDNSTQSIYPNENRWDYAIEYDNLTYFLEFHPGYTSEVETVIKKLKWLEEGLKDRAPEINKLKPKSGAYFWITTKGYCIIKRGNNKYRRMIDAKGIICKEKWIR